MAAQKATGMRRQLAAVGADHAALRARQEELEHFLLAAPATDWSEAVAKARYLLTLFAQTPAAEDQRRSSSWRGGLARGGQSAECGKTERYCRNSDHHCYEENLAFHLISLRSVLIRLAFPP